MGRKCSVYNCKTGYRSQAGIQCKVSIYGFPKAREECNSWLASLPNNRLVYEKVSVHMGVCALHFPPDVPKVKRGTSRYFVPAVPPSIFGNDAVTTAKEGHTQPVSDEEPEGSRIDMTDVKPDVDNLLWQSVYRDSIKGQTTTHADLALNEDNTSGQEGVERLSESAGTVNSSAKPASNSTMILHEDFLSQGASYDGGPSVYVLSSNPAETVKEQCSEDNNSASGLHDKLSEIKILESSDPKRFDGVLMIMTQQCAGGLIEFLGVIFGFLARKTDFYTDVDSQQVEELVTSKFEEHLNSTTNESKRKRSVIKFKAGGKRYLKDEADKKTRKARKRQLRAERPKANKPTRISASAVDNDGVQAVSDNKDETEKEMKPNFNIRPDISDFSLLQASNDNERERVQGLASKAKQIKGNKKVKGWQGLYPCLFCSDIYTHPEVRQRHMKAAHSEKYSEYAPEMNGLNVVQKTPESFDCEQYKEAVKEKPLFKGNENFHPKLFKCDLCYKSFHREDHLQKHIKNHSEDRSVVCDVCGKTLKDKKYLKMHLRAHSNERPYKCVVCHKSFLRSTYLKIHLRTHTGEKPYQCSDCPRAFKDRTDLKRHQRIHTGERPYSCDICNASFKKMWTLKSHRKTHFRDGPDKAFGGIRNPVMRRKILDSEKHFMCDICGITFKTKSGLKFHQMKHSGEKPYQCDICPKSFYLNQYLKLHRAQHLGECPYRCSICNKIVNSKSELEIHKRRHAGVKPYKCSDCSSAFVCTSDLKRHRIHKHTEVKLLKCDLCNKPFKRKQCILQHKRLVHSNERPFNCTMCWKAFKEKSSLNKHRRVHTRADHRAKLMGPLTAFPKDANKVQLPWPSLRLSGQHDHITAGSDYC